MKSTFVEMDALLAAFQLPALHPEIPIQPTIAHSRYDSTAAAKSLLEAKVIRPRDIPADATCSDDILLHGLGAWFKRRTGGLKSIHFDISVHMGTKAENLYQMLNCNGGMNRVYEGRPVLVLTGGDSPFYRMDRAAAKLESICPGLFSTAVDTVSHASFRTVPLRFPMELFETVCWRYWDCDASEVPSDKEAVESLKERFGDDDDTIQHYLPSALRPIFGGKLCASWFDYKKRTLGPRKLPAVVATLTSPYGKRVGQQILTLQRAIAEARKLGADLPDLTEMDCTCVTPAASLFFQPESLAYEIVDDIVNDAYNAGDGTDVMGLAELPETAEELALYFKKLDVAFNVLRHMDKLISLITHKADNYYDAT